MLAWLRSWKGGLVVSVACLVAGLVRLSAAPVDLLTVALFPLAAGYAGAAVVERRMSNARRAAAHTDGPDPTPWTTQPSRLVAWFTAERGYAGGAIVTIPVATSTKDRVGAVLAIVAAVVGLVLVFHDRDVGDHQGSQASSWSSKGACESSVGPSSPMITCSSSLTPVAPPTAPT